MNESESSDPNFFALVCNKTIIAHLKKKKIRQDRTECFPNCCEGDCNNYAQHFNFILPSWGFLLSYLILQLDHGKN